MRGKRNVSVCRGHELANALYLVTRLHLVHAIAVRLHVCKSNIVIATPETAVTVGV